MGLSARHRNQEATGAHHRTQRRVLEFLKTAIGQGQPYGDARSEADGDSDQIGDRQPRTPASARCRALAKPRGLSGRAAKLWDEHIARCHWLTWADGPKARLWCRLQAEADQSTKNMTSSRIAQLRALGSELGFDPPSRARLGMANGEQKPEDPAAKYLD
jgi:hypothetical protein